MAKDPAFLFYSSDFLTGTYTLSDEQVGKFIRLLCLQHQKNELTEHDMLNICKTYDKDIFSKFKKDGDLYYNERLKQESNKRKLYSESRKNNRKKKDMNNICESHDKHMENENENINENIITIKGKRYLNSDFDLLPSDFIRVITEQMFILKKQRVQENQIIELWEAFKLEKLTGETYYNNQNEVYKHFVNWFKTQKFENYGQQANEKRFDARLQYIQRHASAYAKKNI